MRMQFLHVPQKSGRPSFVAGGERQFIALAIIWARVYFPAPRAPDRITACGSRSRPSMPRRRRTTSSLPWKSEKGIRLDLSCCPRGQPQLFADRLHDIGMDHVGLSASVHHKEPVGLAARYGQICIPYALEERSTLLLKTILVGLVPWTGLIAPPSAGHAGRNLGIHEDGQVWLQITAQSPMQGEHRLTT